MEKTLSFETGIKAGMSVLHGAKYVPGSATSKCRKKDKMISSYYRLLQSLTLYLILIMVLSATNQLKRS